MTNQSALHDTLERIEATEKLEFLQAEEHGFEPNPQISSYELLKLTRALRLACEALKEIDETGERRSQVIALNATEEINSLFPSPGDAAKGNKS